METLFAKLSDLKKNNPVAFWVFCVVSVILFPLGISLVVWRFLQQSPDRDLLDKAAREEGKASVHEKEATAKEEEARKGLERITQKKRHLTKIWRRLNRQQKEYENKVKQIENANSWEEVDKLAGHQHKPEDK